MITITKKELKKSLFERIGGRDAVNAVVDIFYEKVIADPKLKPFFDGVDMARQRNKQKAFLTYAFGGAPNYSGKNMREAHKKLVEKGMNSLHFDAVIGHLGKTLKELNVPNELIMEVAHGPHMVHLVLNNGSYPQQRTKGHFL